MKSRPASSMAIRASALSSDGFALGAECLEPDAERRLLGKPTPRVGRERELSMLEGCWRSAAMKAWRAPCWCWLRWHGQVAPAP